MSTPLAVALKLLGVDPNELRQVWESLEEVSIYAEGFNWGPSYELAQTRLNRARNTMNRIVDQL